MTKRVILYLGDAPSLLSVAALDRVNKAVVIAGTPVWKLGRPGVVTMEAGNPDNGCDQIVTPVGIGETAIAVLERGVDSGNIVTTGHDEIIVEVRPPNGNHLLLEMGQPNPALIVPRPVAPEDLTPEDAAGRDKFIAGLDARVKAGNITTSQANAAIAESDASFIAARAKAKPSGAALGQTQAAPPPVESPVKREVREDAAVRLGLPKSATWAEIADAQGKA